MPFLIFISPHQSIMISHHRKDSHMRFSIALLVATLFLQPSAPAQGKKSAAAQNKVLVKKAYDWFNSSSWDSLATIIASDYIEHNPDQGQKPGFDGLKAQFQQYYATFPDMKMEMKDITAEGDKVMTRVVITGTMKGKMGDTSPNGKQIEVEMLEELRMKDGKMVERWGVFDAMKMMAQLGMMPAPDSTKGEKK
jgi:predicted ester cyclase